MILVLLLLIHSNSVSLSRAQFRVKHFASIFCVSRGYRDANTSSPSTASSDFRYQAEQDLRGWLVARPTASSERIAELHRIGLHSEVYRVQHGASPKTYY